AGAELEAEPVAPVDGHRLAASERFPLGGSTERALEAERPALLAVLGLELEEQGQVVLQLAGLALIDAVGRRRHQRAMRGQRLLSKGPQPVAVEPRARRLLAVADLAHDPREEVVEERAARHGIEPYIRIRLGVVHGIEAEPPLQEVAERALGQLLEARRRHHRAWPTRG